MPVPSAPPVSHDSWPSSIKAIRSERFRRLSVEGFWIVLGQAIAVLGSLFGVRLLTGMLDPAAYGELALGMTVATLANQTVLGPLANGVTRFYAPAQEQGDLHGYLIAVRRLVLMAIGIIALVNLLAAAGLLLAGRRPWAAIATAALTFATLSGVNGILSGIQNAARQRSIVALHQGMESWAQYLVAAGLMVWLGFTSAVAMAGYAVAVSLVLASQYVFFLRVVRTRPDVTVPDGLWRERIARYSWPFSIWGSFTWVQLASDRWALGFFSTTKDVGLYAVLLQLGYYPASLATGMAMQFLAPIFYQRAGNARDDRRNASVHDLSWNLTRFALGLTGAAFVTALLFHALIFRTLVAAQYASVSHLLPWTLLAGGVFAAGQTLTLNLMSQLKTQTMMAAKVVTALLGTLMNVAGAYWYGLTGIVVAANVFAASYFLWMVVLAKHEGVEPSFSPDR